MPHFGPIDPHAHSWEPGFRISCTICGYAPSADPIEPEQLAAMSDAELTRTSFGLVERHTALGLERSRIRQEHLLVEREVRRRQVAANTTPM